VPLTAVVAVIVSAPVAVDDAGDSTTVATPDESVSAADALSEPTELFTEKSTTAPETPLPLESSTLAVTVAGAALLTVFDDSVNVMLLAVGVEPEPEPEPEPVVVPCVPPALHPNKPATAPTSTASVNHFFILDSPFLFDCRINAQPCGR